jgi:FkbM family methyltransferase
MLWRALKDIPNGFYVDVGANDPVFESVTNAFYERGWTGINIEPVQNFYERLCKVRQSDINLLVCAGNIDGEMQFYEISENGLSTVDKKIAELEKKAGWQVIERTSQVLTLNTILDKYAEGRTIHFLKIDVEGGEKTVLEGLDLSRWRPWIIVIEATIPFSTELNCADWEGILNTSNYKLGYFDGLNLFYVAEERSDLMDLLRVPPNFFDNFIVDDLYYAERERDSLRAEGDGLRAKRDELWSERDSLRAERDSLRTERDALQAAMDRIFSSYSWRVVAPLMKIIDSDNGHRIVDLFSRLFPLRTLPKRVTLKVTRLSKETFNRLFPLRTLPKRATQKITRLSREGWHKIINKIKKGLVYRTGQITAYYPIAEEHIPMSPQEKAIYLDLINNMQETNRSIPTNREKDR